MEIQNTFKTKRIRRFTHGLKKGIFTLCLLFACLSGANARPIVIQPGFESQNISTKVGVLLTEKSTEDDQLLENIDTLPFSIMEQENPSFGFEKKSLWAKIEITNLTDDPTLVLSYDYPPADHVTLFSLDRNGGYSHSTQGDSFPFSQRDFFDRHYNFRLEIPQGKTQQYYLRIKTQSVLALPLSIRSVKELREKSYNERLAFGVYFGAILVMILYNLFLFIAIRERIYLLYVIYVTMLGFLLFVITGYGFEILVPNTPRLTNIANPLLFGLALCSGVVFSLEFLETKIHANLIYKFGLGFAAILGSVGLSAAFLPIRIVSLTLSFLMIPVALLLTTLALYEAAKGVVTARIYIGAFFGFLFTGIALILSNFSSFSKDFFAMNGAFISSAIEVVVLSIGLAYRYNLLKREKMQIELISKETKQTLSTIQGELDLAQEVHASLLPHSPPVVNGLSISSIYVPCGTIGGDYFDYISAGEDEVGVLLADVTGHGIPAALFASVVKLAYNAEQYHLKTPAIIIENMNARLHQQLAGNHLTAAAMYIDRRKKECIFANGGHPPLILYKRKTHEIIKIKPKGMALGFFPKIISENAHFTFEVGDRFLLYTDGLTDATNEQMEQYGDSKLSEFILANANQKADEFVRTLMADVLPYATLGGGPSDDITVIVIDVV